MDTITAQEIPSQQVPIQTIATPSLNPVQQPPQKQKSFRKFFNISSWVVLFALLPITVLIFLSQDSIPGDLFYPVKRSLENVILAAASVNPATRAAFRTDLTEARFKEAQSLVISKANASGLTTFIDEVQSARLEVVSLKSDTEREKAEEKLAVKIQEYQNGLSTLEAKTEQNIIAYQFQETPSPTTVPPTSAPNLPSVTPTFTPTPTLIPTSNASPFPSSKPQSFPTSTPIPSSIPTLTLAPTVVQAPATVPPQQENVQVSEQKKIAQTIKETKEQLDKIKKDLEEKRREYKEKREERNKEEEKRQGRDESQREDKEDRKNKDNFDHDK